MKKKIISIILTLAIITGTVPTVFALQPFSSFKTEEYTEYGFTYRLISNSSERYIEIEDYSCEGDTIYIPKTFNKVNVDVDYYMFDAEMFRNTNAVAFSVDDDNEYYSVIDGILFNMDGTDLIAYPNGRPGESYTVPEGVTYFRSQCFRYSSLKYVTLPSTLKYVGEDVFGESFGDLYTEENGLIYYDKTLLTYSFDYVYYSDDFSGFCNIKDGTEVILGNAIPDPARCVIIPDSVKTIKGQYLDNACICGSEGSYAQKYAKENGFEFIVLGEGHQHRYIPFTVYPNCINEGRIDYICPCGKFGSSVSYPPDGYEYGHDFIWDENDNYVCRFCGAEYETIGCSCKCHSLSKATFPIPGSLLSFFSDFFFRIKLVFWHLTGTHQYCECGKRHY